MNKTLIIYHRADYDGLGSMLVAKSWLENNCPGEEIKLLGWNYGDNLPDLNETLTYDRIIMVDISFPPEIMLELKDKGKEKICWIDHHITAINNSIKLDYDDLNGYRNIQFAAIENAWEYFFNGFEPPLIIKLLGTYDVWNKERFDWEELVLPLQFALKAKYSLYVDKLEEAWPWLLTAGEDELTPLIESGKLILQYLRGTWGSAIKNNSWEVTVDGKYKAIVCISTEFSSNLFGEKGKEYDAMIVVNWKPNKGVFSMSMYIDPSNYGELHAGEYMQKLYRGGGHKGAAGGFLTKDEFLRLINDCEI